MDPVTPQPLCAKEALELLNCVADPQFDRDKCLRIMDALRNCIVQKVSYLLLISSFFG